MGVHWWVLEDIEGREWVERMGYNLRDLFVELEEKKEEGFGFGNKGVAVMCFSSGRGGL